MRQRILAQIQGIECVAGAQIGINQMQAFQRQQAAAAALGRLAEQPFQGLERIVVRRCSARSAS